MELLVLSFIAGVLTVAAPCILPLLPVVISGSVFSESKKPSWFTPVIITSSLAVSIIVFTLLLKATTALLGVPVMVWQTISGLIIILFGIYTLWQTAWARISSQLHFEQLGNKLFKRSNGFTGTKRAVFTGLALGPIFNSCSPTYALIVASVLPASFAQGLIYLIAYVFGLTGTLLIVGILGQTAVQKLGWLANPNGWFKRGLGVILIVVGVSIVFGLDKKFQAFVLERGWYDPISQLEEQFR